MPAAAPKTCIKCGRDCSNTPRLRNPRGDYACRACVERAGELDVSPLDLSGRHRAPCPKCGAEQLVGVPACPSCGYTPPLDPGSPKLPKPRRMGRIRAVTCRKCSYNLKGLKDGTCPECGHVNALTGRREWDEEVSQEISRDAFRRPLLFLAAGLAVGVGISLARGGLTGAIGYLIAFPILLAVAYAMLWACCITWLGFTSTSFLMLVQLAGIHGVVGAIAAILGCIPVIGSQGLVIAMACGAAYVYLMTEWMDMDSADAKIAAVIIYFAMGILLYIAMGKGWL